MFEHIGVQIILYLLCVVAYFIFCFISQYNSAIKTDSSSASFSSSYTILSDKPVKTDSSSHNTMVLNGYSINVNEPRELDFAMHDEIFRIRLEEFYYDEKTNTFMDIYDVHTLCENN